MPVSMLHHSSTDHTPAVEGKAVAHQDTSALQQNIVHQSGTK